MYKLTDSFKLSYIYFLLGDGAKSTLMAIGPYLREAFSPRQILELGERLFISPSRQKIVEEFYTSLPVLKSESHMFLTLDTFFEQMWKSSNFSVVDVNREYRMPASPLSEVKVGEIAEDVAFTMKIMEQRYAFENEMIEAVSHGLIHEEARLLSSFGSQNFEARTTDVLRNMKNYSIIMNTLLRKAAESGGVHPMYIDKVSSSFARRIEQLNSVATVQSLMREMFLSYCRLVRKHSIKDLSPVVQKSVLLIESDLSADLSLKTVAENLKISAGYLSTVFKKETGKTISQYIREKRVNHAIHLLNTTQLQIQTISWHCGIMDIQYFSKIFKKQTGKTPKEYREGVRQLSKSY